MGGDGGVIASNRKFMRGAGTADHTADKARNANLDPALERQELTRQMNTCAVSGLPLQYTNQQEQQRPIVCCPYGRLYQKEAIVQALLKRRQHQISNSDNDNCNSNIGHIRGLKDLHAVRFHWVQASADKSQNAVLACPVTGIELNGQVAAFLLVPGKPDITNVVSERALKQMGDALVDEYGPIDQTIRLLPPAAISREMQQAWQETIRQQQESKREHSKRKKDKKRKRTIDAVNTSRGGGNKSTAVTTTTTTAATKSKSSNNAVLSSLFTTSDAVVSEQEKKNNLFAR